MGMRYHDPDAMLNSRDTAAKSGATPFDYSRKTLSDPRGDIHPSLDPAYGGYRLSQDFDGQITQPVTIMLDVTGSNQRDAQTVWEHLPQLFGLLTVQNWVKGHLNLQIGGIGDATCDRFPLQLSPFEADGETLDKWISKLVLEGGGGGQSTESYALALWALANQNKLDVWAHGGKGHLFIIFDEDIRDSVPSEHLAELYSAAHPAPKAIDGVEISDSMSKRTKDVMSIPTSRVLTADIVKDIKSKYHVHCIVCGQSSYYDNTNIQNHWKSLFGDEAIIKLPDSRNICEMIAAILGSSFGIATDKIHAELAVTASPDTMRSIDQILAAQGTTLPVKAGGNNRITRI